MSGHDDILFGWGRSIDGELGVGGSEDYIHTPQVIPLASNGASVNQVASGEDFTAFLLSNGEVYTCGSNEHHQLGRGGSTRKPGKVEALENHHITQVACGYGHTLAVSDCGQVFGWGFNNYGQVGVQNLKDDTCCIEKPRLIKALAKGEEVVQIACGTHHSIALTLVGHIFCWGRNNYLQLGIDSQHSIVDSQIESINTPLRISTLPGVPIRQIASGGNHCIALTVSGSMYCWGKNDFGQLGLDSDAKPVPEPTRLDSLKTQKAKYVSCGEDHTTVLTQGGGIFTYGAGMYGQLGHGSTNNEILPRKVQELMGETVTQIVCGRRHTLTFVPNKLSGLSAFGLNGCGQLGTGKSSTSLDSIVKHPRTVLGNWDTKHNSTDGELREHSMEMDAVFNVKEIFSGGDHSFVVATASQGTQNSVSVDFRKVKESQHISTFDKMIPLCCGIATNEDVPMETISSLETIFGSLSCINASFLMDNDEHYEKGSHGIVFENARIFMRNLELSQSNSLSEAISDQLQRLLQQISTYVVYPDPNSPYISGVELKDPEALRVFLILPYCGFFNSTEFLKWHWPFSQAVHKLPEESRSYLEAWYGQMNTLDFRILVKNWNKNLAELIKTGALQRMHGKDACHHLLEFLAILNTANINSYEKVPYDVFYIPEVTDEIDFRSDYYMARYERETSRLDWYFSDYPFIYDPQAKTTLLGTDTTIQMRQAIRSEVITSFNFFVPYDPTNWKFVLHVRRNNIVQDTLNNLQQVSPSDFKKPLEVKFAGEEAVDEGGVTKEYFMLLFREILDPKYGMFKLYPETDSIWFQPNSFEPPCGFFVIGMLVALAIYNRNMIYLPFPLALYKKLLNEPTSFGDMRALDSVMYENLRKMFNYEGDVEELALTFQISYSLYDDVITEDLVAGGKDINVTNDNRRDYVEKYADFVMNSSVRVQFDAFYAGFHQVLSSNVLTLFRASELMAMVVGNENFDWDIFEKNTIYKGVYWKDHPVIKRFWKVFRELSTEDKKSFLQFLTGYDRVPIFGMKNIQLIIQSTGGGNTFLPVAHTCFNLLDLPQYVNEEVLRAKLLIAIENKTGFGLV